MTLPLMKLIKHRTVKCINAIDKKNKRAQKNLRIVTLKLSPIRNKFFLNKKITEVPIKTFSFHWLRKYICQIRIRIDMRD